MRFFITGDKHGDWESIYDWAIKFGFDQDSNVCVIILGDAGLFWNLLTRSKAMIDYHEQYFKFNIWFIDGNHENFKILYKYKENPQISEHIRYIPRGTVINTKNFSILCCGGADSIDAYRRIKDISWWEEEKISVEEDINPIPAQYYKYILTHCCPYNIFKKYIPYLVIPGIDQSTITHSSEKALDQLMGKIDYDRWFFAHYHIDQGLDSNFTCVLNDFIELI